METFSTVLFLNQAPIGYRVQRILDRAELNPAENPARMLQAPFMIAEKSEAGWKVQGTENEELIRQVVDELQLTEYRSAGDVLTAAP